MVNLMDVERDTRHTYIHIPFCKKICSYCDFCKVFYDKRFVLKYLDKLEEEIKNIYKGEYQETIYIGGGTPSSLDLEELEYLFNIIDRLNHDKQTEITFECNFDSITKEKLDLLKNRGVNRLSFGLETTSDKILKEINRELDIDNIEEIISYSKKIGLNNINVDLMYGFENTDIKDLEKDLDFILNLDVQHISTYSLEIHEHTRFYIDSVKRIDEDLDREMYEYINKILTNKGYIHYEISNFSKENYESKHNICYWKNKHYYGFGIGASSYIDNKRITNSNSITDYIKGIANKTDEILDEKDTMIYEVILGLRLKEGINIDEFYNKYKKDIYKVFDIDKLIDECLLIKEGTNIKVPFDNWYIINSILIEFLEVKYE